MMQLWWLSSFGSLYGVFENFKNKIELSFRLNSGHQHLSWRTISRGFKEGISSSLSNFIFCGGMIYWLEWLIEVHGHSNCSCGCIFRCIYWNIDKQLISIKSFEIGDFHWIFYLMTLRIHVWLPFNFEIHWKIH